MRLLSAALLAAAILLAGCTQDISLPAPVSSGETTIRYAFSPAVTPDAPDGFGSEPSLLATPDGALYFTSVLGSATARGDGVWKSTDKGATWSYLGKADYPFGGGDSDLDVLGSGRLLLTGQWRPAALPVYFTGGESVSRSDDGGKTWVPSPAAGYLPAADRNWLATDGPDSAYLVYNDAGTGLMVGFSADGGTTWNPPYVVPGTGSVNGNAGGPNGIAGDAVVDSAGTLFIPYGASIGGGATQRVYRSSDATSAAGHSFDELTVHTTPAGEQAGAIFSTLAVDKSDGLHYVWAETHAKGMRILYSGSADHGATWTPAVQVTPDTVTAAFPWVVAGEKGHIAIAYYATNGSSMPDNAAADATWVPVVSFATVAPGGTLAVTSAQVTPTPNHKGPICTQGTGCTGGRELGDFFEMAMLPGGKVAVVYADDTGDAQANHVAVQSDGPGLCPSMPGLEKVQADAGHPCGGR